MNSQLTMRVAVCLALLWPALVWADGSVRGTATMADGSPVDGLDIQLIPTDAAMPTIKTKSKENGGFIFGLVRRADYRLVAYQSGLRISHIDIKILEDRDVVWEHEAAATPGYELPTFTVTGVRKVHYDLTFESWEGDAGPYGTGQAMTMQDIIDKLESGETEEALTALEAALVNQPDQPTLNYLYAFGLRAAGRMDEAIVAADRTLAAQADFEGAAVLKARMLEEKGDMQGAGEAYRMETEIAQTPEVQRDAWLGLGRTLLAQRDADAAIEALETVIDIAPDETMAYRLLVDAYNMAGQLDKANEIMAKVGEMGDEDPNVLYNLGAQRFNEEDWEAAAGYFERAVAAGPEFADAHLRLGYARLNLGQMDGAVEALRRFLELQPDGDDADTARQLVEALDQ